MGAPTRSRSPQHRSRHSPAQRVGDVVAHCKTATCRNTDSLGDACDAMVAASRTSVVVLDENLQVKGVLTENDILAAVVSLTSQACSIDAWLRGDQARLPEGMVPSLTLSPEEDLQEAARVMCREAGKDSGHACHHVLIDEPGEAHCYLLSALDIAKALAGDTANQDEAHVADMEVRLAMKHQADMATCRLTDKLSDAYRIMFEARQNMALVLDADAHPSRQVRGVITAADALRTFSEYLDADKTTVDDWLRALTPAEHYLARQRIILESKCLSHAARKMSENNMHHLIVLCANEEVTGVISALDVVRALGAP